MIHSDESGLKINKENHWLHVTSNSLYTYLFVDKLRGKEAHKETISILPDYKNWLVHDCFATYFSFENCQHALCNCHILRELQFQIENGKHGLVKYILYSNKPTNKPIKELLLSKVLNNLKSYGKRFVKMQ